ncbi:PREDICTED: olfactory receptor 10AD1-like [Elephantulus edwardii]|uniref:olfactory receptor 10AD1-like n=1 Tax=Elephantulus edwardii TaxID=28737 RepID=UPI0003F0AEA6|nr:PREDICTED: olfactory receptor 10AD1-like [Elephantulus edwardii]
MSKNATMMDSSNSSTVTDFILVGFEQSSPSTRALLFALFLALYSLAMAMNGLIIFITWRDPKLNSPMYFFLGHLSFLDVCFITTTIPQMLVHLVVKSHTFADAIVVLLSPMVLIVISYARILASILGRASSSGRGKTFSTCASHLTVVIFFYTSAMFSYMNPRSTHGPDKDKPFSLLYTIITPMCNPIIYSFRNKEMKGAMVRALRRSNLAQAESV